MNREQRRQEQFRRGLTGTPLPEKQGQCAIDYGHNGQVCVVHFTVKVENLLLTVPQVDAMIEGLNSAKRALIAHQAAAAAQGGPGHG